MVTGFQRLNQATWHHLTGHPKPTNPPPEDQPWTTKTKP
ncbi:hypothetical protein [Pseudomonas phage vB_Pae_SG_WM_Sew_P27]